MFIFYKYLSEKLEKYVSEKLLEQDDIIFADIDESTEKGREYIEHVRNACLEHLGFFLKPNELFSYLVKKGKGDIKGKDDFIIEDLNKVLNTIEQTSSGTESEYDFKDLFDDVDLTSVKLGAHVKDKDRVVVDILTRLNEIDFKL
ncbi:type I restriction-modification system subunit M N-terminal domain-containing protein, partial [Patescibacteria group bacterium]|nr:type I restriction-modification system subunit M N-terminal domain-containing protein [Patescibacteria group bacterium]